MEDWIWEAVEDEESLGFGETTYWSGNHTFYWRFPVAVNYKWKVISRLIREVRFTRASISRVSYSQRILYLPIQTFSFLNNQRVGSASNFMSFCLMFPSSTGPQWLYNYWRWAFEVQEYHSCHWWKWCQEIGHLCFERVWKTPLLVCLPPGHRDRFVASGCQGWTPRRPLSLGFGADG